MRIVVTGSSGRLGMAVVRDLLEQGHQVVPIDVRPPRQEIVPSHVLELTKTAELRQLVDGADAVCHLGNFPGIDPSAMTAGFANNLVSTHSVFDAVLQGGVGKVVYASSIQAYGCLSSRRDGRFISVPKYLPLDEDHPLLPQDAYPLSKAMGEGIGQAYCRREPRLQVFSLRFTWIVNYDRQMSPEAAMGAIRAAGVEATPAGSLFTYVHVQDAAEAVRRCCEVERPGHTPLNIVASRPVRAWSAQEIVRQYGVLPEFKRALTASDTLVCGERARQILGFVAEWPGQRKVA